MIIPATANLTCAMTKGCEESSAILVAVDADAHKKANSTPAAIHLYSFLILYGFNFSNIKEKLEQRLIFERNYKSVINVCLLNNILN
jgi:hypothetical protein